MTGPVTVTQADREAAAEFFRDERTGLSVKFNLGLDPSPLLEAFARHRLDAEERGARMALEAAAKVADEYNAHLTLGASVSRVAAECEALQGKAGVARHIATAIRQTDPAQIVKGQPNDR